MGFRRVFVQQKCLRDISLIASLFLEWFTLYKKYTAVKNITKHNKCMKSVMLQRKGFMSEVEEFE
jgi:hypothetical protein